MLFGLSASHSLRTSRDPGLGAGSRGTSPEAVNTWWKPGSPKALAAGRSNRPAVRTPGARVVEAGIGTSVGAGVSAGLVVAVAVGAGVTVVGRAKGIWPTVWEGLGP